MFLNSKNIRRGNLYLKGCLYREKKHPGKVRPRLSEISPYKKILMKNQNLFIWRKILPPNRDTTFIIPSENVRKPTGISLWWDIFFRYKRFVSLCMDVFGYKMHVIFLKIAEKNFSLQIKNDFYGIRFWSW